jgi:hypothetical protein
MSLARPFYAISTTGLERGEKNEQEEKEEEGFPISTANHKGVFLLLLLKGDNWERKKERAVTQVAFLRIFL